MKILVTGTAGFIGFHLAKRLLEEGNTVIGLDCINNYYDVRIKYGRLKITGIVEDDIKEGELIQSSVYHNYKFIKLELENRNGIMHLFNTEKFDVVVNLAAQAGVRYSIENPYVYVNSNVIGFLNILEGCRNTKVKNFIYASTSSVYGLNTEMPLHPHQTTDHPMSLYAATKKANEVIAHSYSHLYNLPTTGLRFFTVYGPWGRPDMALFLFTKAILEGNVINVFNNGEMIRDFTYVGDIVESITRLCSKPATPNPAWDGKRPDTATSTAPYRIFNIGNSDPVKLIDYIKALENNLGKKASMNLMSMQPGDVSKTHADVTDLIKWVNFKPQTTIHTGIKIFVDWYFDFFKVKDV